VRLRFLPPANVSLAFSSSVIWIIAALTVLAILIRPKNWPEAVWPVIGATLLVVFRLLGPGDAFAAVRQGTSVYLFLAGMMLLAELARRQGLFAYLASHAVDAAKGSRARLFLLVYLVGVVVTALLSNDATAVVLTPAVYAAVKKTGAPVLPYLLICAFVANAASFVLPISNPANLVIFGRQMPPLPEWMKTFTLPSILAIATTYLLLRLLHRNPLRGGIDRDPSSGALSCSGQAVGFEQSRTVLKATTTKGGRRTERGGTYKLLRSVVGCAEATNCCSVNMCNAAAFSSHHQYVQRCRLQQLPSKEERKQ